jgi:hypothetical protein
MIKNRLAIIVLLILVPICSYSQLTFPSGFFGTIQIDGSDAPTGTVVKPTINGIEYPTSFTVVTSGQYGLLNVNADEPSTTGVKEGGVNGDIVNFIAQIGEIVYGLTPTGTWNSGTNQQLNLSSTGVIPVELSSFTANVNNNSVNLYWTTESESNNFGFEIQRSKTNTNFNKIDFIQGHGTTSQPYSYEYKDSYLPAGKYFYRLKQIDTDGTSSLSKTLEITIFNPSKYKLLQNYPNPFNPSTIISFEIPENSKVTLSIFSINGHLVRELLKSFKAAGTHSCTWNGKDESGKTVSNGIYLYRISTGQFSQTRKMILAK